MEFLARILVKYQNHEAIMSKQGKFGLREGTIDIRDLGIRIGSLAL